MESVATAAGATVANASATGCVIQVPPSHTGWNYIHVSDPNYGSSQLAGVVRQSDGKAISLRNVWQTDRTLRDGKAPLYENLIHIADDFASLAPQTYTLTFVPSPRLRLEVKSVDGVPDGIATEHVGKLTVTFNKAIDPATFTADDITLSVEGMVRDASAVAISTTDNVTFTLDLSATDSYAANGYHALTVQTAGITDAEGHNGSVGKTVGWTAYADGTVKLLTSSQPADGGKVYTWADGGEVAPDPAPASGEASFGDVLTFKAVPAKGYAFTSWTVNGAVSDCGDVLSVVASGDMDIVAHFTLSQHNLSIAATEGGTVTGSPAGIYTHGERLTFEPIPESDYVFDRWEVNGHTVADCGPQLTMTVDSDTEVKAVFKRVVFRQRISFLKGWNWISSYIATPIAASSLTYANRIVAQPTHSAQGVGGDDLETDSLSTQQGYKVEASMPFVLTLSGPMRDLDAQPVSLQAGWNWIAYPLDEGKALQDVIGNADEGDVVAQQTSFAEFAEGQWQGTLVAMEPGNAYLYKSVAAKQLDVADGSGAITSQPQADGRLDVYSHASTMNVTATVERDGQPLTGQEWCLVAAVGEACRGVGCVVNGLHCITVHGQADTAESVTFTLENSTTGECLEIAEELSFTDDMVGSRKSPLTLTVKDPAGIPSATATGQKASVYTLEGILVAREATPQVLEKLPRGIYIIGHRKYVVK